MNYCSECGHKVVNKIPPGDTTSRFMCESCNIVHYQNPKVIAGCIAQWQGKVLLCKRAIEPRIGSWTVPAGYMENGETMERAALRETREETGADVRLDVLYSVFDIEAIDQIYIIYRGVMTSPNIVAGPECSEARLFELDEIPWDNLFYPAIKDLLLRFKSDITSGQFSIYMGTSIEGTVARIERDKT